MPVGAAQEPVEDVEQLGDVGELCGADRYSGSVGVRLPAVARNRLGGVSIHRIILGPSGVDGGWVHRLVAVVARRRVSAAAWWSRSR